ncbi:MAG TPA: oligopeptide/dipeptide ABC transporter ATP-binding protein [Phycisphaerae bacterium]|nr:oligopeptide/dipeptide ABC transporter ATP-binding protein [Phycisphaerae bacterium]
MQANTDNVLLAATGLKTYFPVRRGMFGEKRFVRAVDGVDLWVRRGRTLGLVGESGSGKTTVGRTILRLVPATAGRVVFDGVDVFSLVRSDMRSLRRRMQVIFQDPVGSLNPRMTVEGIVSEPLAVHASLSRRERRIRVGDLLERVGLSAAYAKRYPHEFSGGQRQRIGIARALGPNPDFIVCDEPISALDVSIQGQILNLLNDLQDELGLSYLFIAHNLAVVEHFADEVAVMYLGRIVEYAARDTIYANPRHPYTQSLLSAVPEPDPAKRSTHVRLPGEIPSPISPPSGCPFHPRCPLTREMAPKLPDSETATILSEGESVRVVARCTHETPVFAPAPDDPAHHHACLLRHPG